MLRVACHGAALLVFAASADLEIHRHGCHLWLPWHASLVPGVFALLARTLVPERRAHVASTRDDATTGQRLMKETRATSAEHARSQSAPEQAPSPTDAVPQHDSSCSDAAGVPPLLRAGDVLVRFGKFEGRPFKGVHADPHYVHWLLDLADAPKCASMRELRAYLKVVAVPPPPPAPSA